MYWQAIERDQFLCSFFRPHDHSSSPILPIRHVSGMKCPRKVENHFRIILFQAFSIQSLLQAFLVNCTFQ